jgi:polysaccharide export outer membrane protein
LFLLAIFLFGLHTGVHARAGYKLDTGDKLKVTVFGEDHGSGECEVDATGAISTRLLGRGRVKGRVPMTNTAAALT